MSSRSRQYKLDRELNQKLRSEKMTNNQTVKDFYFSMSVNIISPDFIKCGSRRDFNIIYEVTKGVSMSGGDCYGLSVHEWNGEEYERSEKSEMFYSIDDINTAIKEL